MFGTLMTFLRDHGTKVLAFVSGTIAAVAGVTGIIPDAHLKYYMGIIAVLTFWRGFINSELLKKAPPSAG